jgi:hypothetical protein
METAKLECYYMQPGERFNRFCCSTFWFPVALSDRGGMAVVVRLREHNSGIDYRIPFISLQNLHRVEVQFRYLGKVFHHC